MRWIQLLGGGQSWWYLIDQDGKIIKAMHERDLFKK
jgi:hypothetical protein